MKTKTVDRKTEAEAIVAKIRGHLESGGVLYACTYTRRVKYTLKALKAWDDAGIPLFKAGSDGLYIARGRSYDYAYYTTLVFAQA